MTNKRSPLSADQQAEYHRNGCLLVQSFCQPEEICKLYETARREDILQKNALDLSDQSGKKTRLSLWFTPGDDVFGYLTRSEKMVNATGQLLDGDAAVCHFHSKLMQKEPHVGGAWEWHQDYGYWYKNQFMFPDKLISVMIALTDANKENGCLQVIRGSHKMGRVNHGFAGEQVGADMQMVTHALKTMELHYCELEAGDALFFHPNLLHRSAANLSAHPRWSLIACYNSQDNLAYNEQSSAWRVPVDVVPDDAILNWQAASLSEADFLRKEDDPALKDTGWEDNIPTDAPTSQ